MIIGYLCSYLNIAGKGKLLVKYLQNSFYEPTLVEKEHFLTDITHFKFSSYLRLQNNTYGL